MKIRFLLSLLIMIPFAIAPISRASGAATTAPGTPAAKPGAPAAKPGAPATVPAKASPKVISNGPTTGGKMSALSFDDAPTPGTQQLIDVLDNLDVPATFFIEGIFASHHRDMLKKIGDYRFEIGNHTWNHPNITKVDDTRLLNELKTTNDIIQEVTGLKVHVSDPRGGAYNQHAANIVYSQQMSTILWTVSCADYMNPPKKSTVSQVLARTKPGAIILLHDGVRSTREALPEIVNTLRDRGYTFVTVGQMLEMEYGVCPWDSSYHTGGDDNGENAIF